MIVIRTIKLKLDVSKEDQQSLLRTMKEYAVAFEICSEWGFKNHSANKINCHNATYHSVRQIVPNLPTSLIQGARDCACDALKSTKCKFKPIIKDFSAMRYNSRVIRICFNSRYATLATSNGRIKVSFIIPAYYERYINWKIKSSNIVFYSRDKRFYVHVSIEHIAPEKTENTNVLGIDRGVKNIAVCSNNTFFNSRHIRNIKGKYQHLRAELRSKGTRSTKRKLKKLAGRERRFVADVNHCISKKIVQTNFEVFALEDLSRIRVQKRRGKYLNKIVWNWSFYQLEQFIRYKAENIGKSTITVDSRFTSQKCSNCGHIYKGNRNGSQYLCRKCGFELHADLNAARNIAQAGISGLSRLPVNQPNVACL